MDLDSGGETTCMSGAYRHSSLSFSGKMIPYGSGVSSPGSMVLHSEHSVPSPTLQSAGFPVHLHIGRQDFYSISYTVSAISLYVSYCSNRSAMFWRNVYSRSNNISHITQESSCEPNVI